VIPDGRSRVPRRRHCLEDPAGRRQRRFELLLVHDGVFNVTKRVGSRHSVRADDYEHGGSHELVPREDKPLGGAFEDPSRLHTARVSVRKNHRDTEAGAKAGTRSIGLGRRIPGADENRRMALTLTLRSHERTVGGTVAARGCGRRPLSTSAALTADGLPRIVARLQSAGLTPKGGQNVKEISREDDAPGDPRRSFQAD